MHGYGTGQSGDPFASAQLAANAMEGMLNAIEPGTKFGKPSYTAEVEAYQKAGQYGVSAVAPAIDAAGAPQVTQPLTHQAWDLNTQLHAGIQSWGPFGPGYRDMQQARALAWHMLVGYKQAIGAGRQLVASAPQRAALPAAAARAPVSEPLQAAAQTLVSAIRSATQAGGKPARWSREQGQAAVMWQPTASFQKAYNAAANGNLKVDGVYGPATQAALIRIVGTSTITAAYGPLAVAGWR